MEFKLRPMEEKDLSATLAWRNDPEVRKFAQTQNIISSDEHEAMFKFNNAIKLVFEVDSVPAGYVQFTRDPDDLVGEWSFHMANEFRGKGLSEIMLLASLYYIKKEEGYNGVKSLVLKHNDISNHLHRKFGFEEIERKNNLIEYYLSI